MDCQAVHSREGERWILKGGVLAEKINGRVVNE
jgi:hypothetical protein